MTLLKLKIPVLFFLLLLTVGYSYCQDSSKVSVWVGYENLVPLNKPSDFFSFNKIKRTTEIQNGNGIIASVYYHAGKRIALFVRSGYFWHKVYKSDTLINSLRYPDEVYYRIIPISTGAAVRVISNSRFDLSANFDVSYNFITRDYAIKELSQESTTTINNFGYSISVNPMLMRLNTHLGFAKKR